MRKTILAAVMASMALTADPSIARDRHHDRTTDNGIRYWKGNDGRTYCRKSNGTTGLLIGGVAGALVGRTIDTRGDRTPGTLIGAVGGALIGREIERSSARCR